MKAVVFIDVQNDFAKGGALPFAYPEQDNVSKIIDFAKKCVDDPNCKIYATRDTHEATKYIFHYEGDTKVVEPQSGYLATLEGRKLPAEHCIEGKDGWNIVDNLMDVIYTHCTSIRVLSNAVLLRAKFPNTKITVRADLCGDVSKEAHEAALTVMKMQQITVEGQELLFS